MRRFVIELFEKRVLRLIVLEEDSDDEEVMGRGGTSANEGRVEGGVEAEGEEDSDSEGVRTERQRSVTDIGAVANEAINASI
ncbi:hypothetical protein DID88_004806 [Monilinia fructigena]|uniref:Uncharacterized protein n=1 Tax=Monilinia fructigena TaxID=38457 RepID=A0A395IPJ3_9HELO|nr:hypothetical protein DID88_004806 [Monilinia fructigena]